MRQEMVIMCLYRAGIRVRMGTFSRAGRVVEVGRLSLCEASKSVVPAQWHVTVWGAQYHKLTRVQYIE
jgi:hypothetical protein